MAYALFTFNGIDYSDKILMPSYKINSQPLYEEWQDANGITHRDYVRNRVSGTFDIYFTDVNDFYTFVNSLKNTRRLDLTYEITLYINNELTARTIYAYISYEFSEEEPIMSIQHDSFTIEIEEA
ncbi:MAG: hypothetical protein IIT65_00540 [Lachnospiraceae bacterium]|nr:hypothetical protein [Lachnospiraceae bacterium]